MTNGPQKTALVALTGLSLLGVVSGCSSSTSTQTASTTPSPNAPSATPSPLVGTTPPSAAATVYKDGTYAATGSYTSPGGSEKVDVSITVKADAVTAVTVTPESTNPNGKKFQKEFAGAISALVVGKPLDGLSVSKVAGSSLTSGGFNDAIQQIKADARS